MTRAVMFWSTGKDSAAALHVVKDTMEIEALITTINRPDNHVAVHRVPEPLLDAQAASIGLPLEKIVIPVSCPNEEYESRVLAGLKKYAEAGIDRVVFGDINLADIREYREALLSRAGMQGSFPLWERDTRELSRWQIDSGISAVVTCVDNQVLPRSYAGREFDQAFLDSLPDGVDPCGENGEFHTFVHDAPVFSRPVPCRLIRTLGEGPFSYAIIGEATKEKNHVDR